MRFLLAAVVVFFWASASLAERRVALVFGTDRYETIRPLANAVNDARAVEAVLEGLDFEVYSETNRDLERMRRALDDFEKDAAGANVALIFFAGHGVEIAGDNRLLPTDADSSSLQALKATSLALNEVQDIATRVADTALIIVDACRDDPFGRASDPAGRGAFSMSLLETVRPGFGRMGRADNTLYAFSAAPGQTALDGEDGNSPFTAALVRYLGTEGLAIRSVLTLVQQEVYDRTSGTQLPYIESGLPSLFFARRTAGELAERERLLLAMAEIDDAARQDVERVALQANVPLAPLYGALIGSDLAELDRQQRSEKLMEAATAFTRVSNELRTLRSGDEQVTALRRQAEEQLSLGAFDAARERLTEAAGIDANSRETLKANLLERTLSEAATHYLNGGAALAELEYRLAMADYGKAAALFDEVDGGLVPPDSRFQQLNALGALGRINTTIGSLPDAARAFERQRSVAQQLTAQYPGDTGLQLALALSHDNLGDVLFEQGRIADALIEFRAGHAVRLAVWERDSTDEELRFALSNSYERLGRIHHRQGDLAAAKAFYLDKFRLGSEMAALPLPGYRWARDLSLSDELLGDVAREQGDLAVALGHYTASLERMVPIRNANPDDPGLKRFTSITLDRIGDMLAAQGDLSSALAKYQESRDLRLALVATDPANVDWQYLLGISHERIGDVQLRMGDRDAAKAAFEAKHQVASQLAQSDPTNVRWQRDLSVADERLGSLARDRGDPDSAMKHFRSSLDRMTRVREASPTDMELNRFVSNTQDDLANALMDKGETAAALALYRDSLAIRERLVEMDPANADWRFLLGVSHELIGNAHMRIGEPGKAAQAYRQEVAAMSVLLENDPENRRWWRVVSIANELLGDAYLAAGDPAAALEEYGASLERMRRQRDEEPENLGMQRFTAVTLRKIGEARLAAGDSAAALTAFSDSLSIARRLVAANPDNAWWQRDLMLAYKGVADAGENAEANIHLALDAAESIRQLRVFGPSDQVVVDQLTTRLEALKPQGRAAND